MYGSFFNTNNKEIINMGEEIKHFNQNCKNYFQNTSDPPNYTISKTNGLFFDIENNNENNPSLNEHYQNLKYDDLSNYDLRMNPENKNNYQNNNQAIEAGVGKDLLNKDLKIKISENQRDDKKKSSNDEKKKSGGKKKNSKNNCISYISTLTIVWSALLILI
ncbi:hypothetical protein DMUE_4971 [Dictyocoela muelleri]|nr:hypothetical protein DMUE_4971 [Dictyocoela muelleri]